MSPVFEVIASMEFSIVFCLKNSAGKPAEGQQAWAILDLDHEKGSNCLAKDPCLFSGTSFVFQVIFPNLYSYLIIPLFVACGCSQNRVLILANGS